MTIDYYGDQVTKTTSLPRLPVSPQDQQPVFMRRGTYTTPGAIAVSKGIALIPVKKGEVFLGGTIACETGTLDTGAILQFGDGTDVDAYGEGAANDGDLDFGKTYSFGFGSVFAADGYIVVQCKAASAGLITTKTINIVAFFGHGGI